MNIFIIFPKDSEALFNINCKRTFGGASVQVYNIAKELSKYNGIRVFSIIPKYKQINFKDSEKFNLIQTYNEKDIIILKFYKFIKTIIKLKPDIIIQHGLTTESCFMALLCSILKIKFIFMFAHDVEVNGLRQFDRSKVLWFPLLLKFSNKIITQNEYQSHIIKSKYKRDNYILYSGFEIKRKKINKSIEGGILWVARCEKWKQPELFIELAKHNKDLKFIMICPESNDKNYFYKIKEESKNHKNITFIDFISYYEIDEFFEKAYLFVNTSLYEGFPQTFIQSMINKTPIISLKVNPENFLNIFDVGIFCNNDFKLMNKKIRELVNNKNYYFKLSQNAFNYAIKNHNIEINAKKIITLINT